MELLTTYFIIAILSNKRPSLLLGESLMDERKQYSFERGQRRVATDVARMQASVSVHWLFILSCYIRCRPLPAEFKSWLTVRRRSRRYFQLPMREGHPMSERTHAPKPRAPSSASGECWLSAQRNCTIYLKFWLFGPRIPSRHRRGMPYEWAKTIF